MKYKTSMVVTNGGKSASNMETGKITLRKATLSDMAAINEIIDAAIEAHGGAEALDGLDELLAQSDYIVVTVPRTPETIDMIRAEQMTRMKPTAMLVGISRGGIINQEALVNALRTGQIAAAATDVTKPEPLPPESELWDLENRRPMEVEVEAGPIVTVTKDREIYFEEDPVDLDGLAPVYTEADMEEALRRRGVEFRRLENIEEEIAQGAAELELELFGRARLHNDNHRRSSLSSIHHRATVVNKVIPLPE